MKTLSLDSLILSMMVYIGLKFFSAPSPSLGIAFKLRSQTFHTNVILAYIIKTPHSPPQNTHTKHQFCQLLNLPRVLNGKNHSDNCY